MTIFNSESPYVSPNSSTMFLKAILSYHSVSSPSYYIISLYMLSFLLLFLVPSIGLTFLSGHVLLFCNYQSMQLNCSPSFFAYSIISPACYFTGFKSLKRLSKLIATASAFGWSFKVFPIFKYKIVPHFST